MSLERQYRTVSGPDLAFHHPTWQSSNYSGVAISQVQASNAVDGNTDDDLFHESCTHTKFEAWPWWAVDLGAVTAVKSVMITNRVGSCKFFTSHLITKYVLH